MLDNSKKQILEKFFRRLGKILYMIVSLIEKILESLLGKTKIFLKKSFNEDKKMKTEIDTFLDKAKDMLEDGLLENEKMGFEIDTFINNKLDEIVFFRDLMKSCDEISIPQEKKNQLKSIENEIFSQLLTYSELQKKNTKAEVALIGGFNSGKSTIINSFLKEEVCPSDPNPTTSSVTKFYFANKKRISLDGKEISEEKYIKRVRHENLGKDTKTYFFEYGHSAEIFNSIILYDTPGFGNAANKNDDRVTEDILKDVDVVIYIIDINKGTLDSEDIKRLTALKKEKNKKFYCIVNKVDTKTKTAIDKIKKEVERFGIFDIVITYSAKNIIKTFSKYSIEDFLNTTRDKIYRKSVFTSSIKGELFTGRRNKIYYRLILDEQEIDEDGINALIQRNGLEKIFKDISSKKHKILEDSFYENEKRYKQKEKILLDDILYELNNIDYNDINDTFQKELTDIYDEFKEIEKSREKSIKIAIGDAFIKAIYIKKRTEKGLIWDDHYYKLSLSHFTYEKNLMQLEEIYNEYINILKDELSDLSKKYDITFEYPTISNTYIKEKSITILNQYLDSDFTVPKYRFDLSDEEYS